jgi:phage baseplate assembly protein W
MPDIAHFWGSDLQVSASGGLRLVDGLDLANQRIIRRLMTAPGAYIWHPTYGAGLPQQIGGTINEAKIKSIITSQIYQEAVVAKSPAPKITITPFLNGVNVHIAYTMAVSGTQNILSFDVSK